MMYAILSPVMTHSKYYNDRRRKADVARGDPAARAGR